MINKKHFTTLLLMSCCAILAPAYANNDVGKTQTIAYQEGRFVNVTAKFGYSTEIVFSKDEMIEKVIIGDAAAWQAVAVDSRIMLKPIALSETNMLVVTDKRNYNFYLRTATTEEYPFLRVKFSYANINAPDSGRIKKNEEFNLLQLDIDKINWGYSFTPIENHKIAPLQVFDDGKFTYIKFKENQPLPAVFAIDDSKEESLVNYSIYKGYMVIRETANRFILRYGKAVVMIFNESLN